jgi:hypothetical protein
MRRTSGSILARAAAAVVMLLGVAAFPRGAAGGPVLPDFSPSNFAPGATIDNPYLPLTPGTRLRYSATVTDPDNGETAQQIDEDFVTTQTQVVGAVTARVVHARSWEDGVLIEDTRDFYAQDKSGNVWYLGEDTTAFEYDDAGKLISASKEGSWRTGVHGAKPGFIMPANPQPGFNYYQEFSPADGAVDQAQVVSLNGSLTVPFGTFTNVQKSLETTDVEPGVREFKYYAPGVGLIMTEEDVNAAGVALNTFTLQSVTTGTAVPMPPAVWSGLLTGGIYVGGRLARRAFPKPHAAS